MSDSGIGFGGFLLGLGSGWYLFQYIDFSFDIISYILIIIGIGMILNALLTQGRRKHPISGAFGGVVGGLILAIFLTQGFGIITDITHEVTDISSGTYRATKTFTLNTPVTSDSLGIIIESVNGGMDIYSWTGDDVKYEIEIKARGDTNAEANENLVNFEHNLDNSMSGTVQQLTLTFPISMTEWSDYAVSIDVYVPADVATQYDLDTTNGAINLDDIVADRINIDTTNGVITLSEVESPTMNVETINGAIFGTITSTQTSFSATNGAIDLSLTKTSGVHIFSTTNGAIELTLPTGADVGYKINVDTSIGVVDVNLPNMEYSVDRARTKIGETTGYSSKQVQISITADTTIGGIELN